MKERLGSAAVSLLCLDDDRADLPVRKIEMKANEMIDVSSFSFKEMKRLRQTMKLVCDFSSDFRTISRSCSHTTQTERSTGDHKKQYRRIIMHSNELLKLFELAKLARKKQSFYQEAHDNGVKALSVEPLLQVVAWSSWAESLERFIDSVLAVEPEAKPYTCSCGNFCDLAGGVCSICATHEGETK